MRIARVMAAVFIVESSLQFYEARHSFTSAKGPRCLQGLMIILHIWWVSVVRPCCYELLVKGTVADLVITMMRPLRTTV